MEDVSSLIEKLSWDTPVEEKEDAIQKLYYIKEEDLHLLLQPISKSYWDEAAELVISLGYPRVNSILPGLLEWIQDINWPGASRIADFLREIGDPLIPYIKNVINHHRQDTEWIEWIFEKIIDHWNTEQVLQIRDELILMSQEKDNDFRALKTLLIHGLYQKYEADELIQRKKDEIAFKLKELEKTSGEIDCEELHKEFSELIYKQSDRIKQYYEDNNERFNICNAKSNLKNYLSDIEIFTTEFLS